jgi:hypothetical protein
MKVSTRDWQLGFSNNLVNNLWSLYKGGSC